MLLKIYLSGILFLLGAIILNAVAKFLKLPSWYDFVANPKLTVISFIWLFILYPFFLGLLVYVLKRFF